MRSADPEQELCGLLVQITGADGEVLNHARMNGTLAPISRFRRAPLTGSVAIPHHPMEFPASAGQVARQVAMRTHQRIHTILANQNG